MLLTTNIANQRQEIVRLRPRNIDYYLTKHRELLSEVNLKLVTSVETCPKYLSARQPYISGCSRSL